MGKIKLMVNSIIFCILLFVCISIDDRVLSELVLLLMGNNVVWCF